MVRSVITNVAVIGQAVLLLITGCAMLWFSHDLMLLLIHAVGEEYALGAENVIRREDGRTQLTNPGAMGAWTMPFWALGVLQVSSGITLVWLWRRNRTPGNHRLP